jgi:hypothetical protein
MAHVTEKGQNCIFSFFDKWIFNEYRCLRFGGDRPLKCEGCFHYMTDALLEDNVERIKCDEEVNSNG